MGKLLLCPSLGAVVLAVAEGGASLMIRFLLPVGMVVGACTGVCVAVAEGAVACPCTQRSNVACVFFGLIVDR
jgi:hypothetical protein